MSTQAGYNCHINTQLTEANNLVAVDYLVESKAKTTNDFKQEGAGKQLLRCLFCALAGKGEHDYDDKMKLCQQNEKDDNVKENVDDAFAEKKQR